MLKFRIERFQFHVLPMRTRFPFRYGISSLTWVPHLVVTAELRVADKLSKGMAADGLPPKWFTKNPVTTFEADLAEMLAVIQNAARLGVNAGERETTYPAWWREVYDEQKSWAEHVGLPGLLSGFGISLMERAILDGLCRAAGRPLHELLFAGALVADMGVARPELAGLCPSGFLPEQPLGQIRVRHTVGMADWLAEAEIAAEDRVHDGLPQSLEACARTYELSHFKIKLSGDLEPDRTRLRGIDRVLENAAPPGWRCTLDGNEAFTSLAAFRDYYESLRTDASLRRLLTERLLFVEQPLRRDVTLTEDVAAFLANWKDAPPLLIDEADGDLTSLPKALRLGYSGVSHKNCKGIFKGLANLATIHQANSADGGQRFISGEDLVNVGPLALTQDLAVQALLGVEHVERNGHHYMAGLSMWPATVQEAALSVHPDLLHAHKSGFPTLTVRQGKLSLATVNAAPFGCGLDPGLLTSELEPLDAWIKRGGLAN